MKTLKPRTRLFIDQYGQRFWARSVKDLREQIGGRVSRMYRDAPGGAEHIGYVIGRNWLTEYAIVARKI